MIHFINLKFMLKKIFFLLLALIFCLAVYYPVSFFLEQKNKNNDEFISEENIVEEPISDQADELIPSELSNDNTEEKQENIIENLLDNETTSSQTETSSENLDFFINITPPDCIRECEPYEYNEKELLYCQNVCGLSLATAKKDCEDLDDLEKDYCLKNNAIIDKNIGGCNEIADTKLKESCQKRVQEDFIEANF